MGMNYRLHLALLLLERGPRSRRRLFGEEASTRCGTIALNRKRSVAGYAQAFPSGDHRQVTGYRLSLSQIRNANAATSIGANAPSEVF